MLAVPKGIDPAENTVIVSSLRPVNTHQPARQVFAIAGRFFKTPPHPAMLPVSLIELLWSNGLTIFFLKYKALRRNRLYLFFRMIKASWRNRSAIIGS